VGTLKLVEILFSAIFKRFQSFFQVFSCFSIKNNEKTTKICLFIPSVTPKSWLHLKAGLTP
jgi:hypothetical protein